jgi:cytochrome c2
MGIPMRTTVVLLAFALLLIGCVPSSSMSNPNSGNGERGAQLFAHGHDGSPPCMTCHQVVTGQVGFSVGPNLDGIGKRAGTRVAQLTAEDYLRQSILEPNRYLVAGYRNMMYPDYNTHFTEQDIQDLIAYLLTL